MAKESYMLIVCLYMMESGKTVLSMEQEKCITLIVLLMKEIGFTIIIMVKVNLFPLTIVFIEAHGLKIRKMGLEEMRLDERHATA